VLYGSNLGNANSHDWHNLPLLLAGGGFKHGRHVTGDAKNNTPMSNLFVRLMQNMGIEPTPSPAASSFAMKRIPSSTPTPAASPRVWS
jgi:hypothetical protein